MSTLNGRTKTALLVVDVQNDVVNGAYERDVVVARIATLVEHARTAGAPVVWVQHNDAGMLQGTDEWALVPELVPAIGEPHIDKQYGDAFEGTDLEEVLAGLGVGGVVVAGAETDACIRSTIHGAFARGYDTTLVGDAHTAGDKTAWGAPPVDQVIAHTNLYWGHQSAPGKTAAVHTTEEVAFL